MSSGTKREVVFAVGGVVAWGVLGGLYFALSNPATPAPAATARIADPRDEDGRLRAGEAVLSCDEGHLSGQFDDTL